VSRAPRGLVRPGRPTKLTPVQQTIVESLEAENFCGMSQPWAGVSETTVYRWLADDEADDARAEFREAITRVRARVVNVLSERCGEGCGRWAVLKRASRR
jgi:hypothetical protein